MDVLSVTETEERVLRRHLLAIENLQAQVLSLRSQLDWHLDDLEMCWQAILRNNDARDECVSALDNKTGELAFEFVKDIPTHSLRLKNGKI